jgi:hypothetical protein
VRLAIARANARAPGRFRVVEFSVQDDHVHLLVEAASKRALSAGVRSVSIRVARYVNDLLNRRGPLWADRWHGHALRSPREVRNALVYVLANFRKHRRRPPGVGLDPYSSAPWFDGFRTTKGPARDLPAAPFAERPPPRWDALPLPVSSARTWLLTSGWRRRGLLGLAESPRS